VTSTYYHDAVPGWVKAWNEKGLFDKFKGKSWELLLKKESYIARDLDDRPYEADLGEMGRTFPHFLGDGSSRLFPVIVYVTPMGDELTLDFAKTLIQQEKLGQKGFTDYLSISFSSPDMAGHLFGQSSLEYEDAVLRVDRLLADLFAWVDRHVGLDHTVIVLSADHGGVEAPEYVASLGINAGRFPLDLFRKGNPIEKPLKLKYGRSDLIEGHSHPYLYLNMKAIESAGLDLGEVERFVASELMKLPGIAYVMTRSDLLEGNVVLSPVQQMIRRSFHPSRSGNLHVVSEQYWFFHSSKEPEQMGIKGLAAIHGSPWRYDTFVPILFAGPGVPHQKISRFVGPQDIAPTLATYLGIKHPSGSIGVP